MKHRDQNESTEPQDAVQNFMYGMYLNNMRKARIWNLIEFAILVAIIIFMIVRYYS